MYCSTPVLKAQACWNTSPIIVLHYSLFQAAFSDTVTSASAPPNSSRFKNDAGIFYRFYCESRANRESCHHSVFPFQRQMNALLPRDQATLPKACLGSLLGPMFARRVLLLALWPLGKLEATLLETSDNRIQQGHFNHASGALHFLPPPMSPCQHRKRCLGLAVSPPTIWPNQVKRQTAYAYSICCNFRGNSLCVDLRAASRLEIRIASVRTCFLGFFWSIKSKIRSKSILGATSAHASTASSSVSWTAESSNAFEPWHGPRSHNLIRAQHSDRDNGNIVSTNVCSTRRWWPHRIKLFRQDSFANEWLKSSAGAWHGNKQE